MTPSEALDFLVAMAHGHDYADATEIYAAEDVVRDALTGRAESE